jgi:hypothetical protein
MHGSANTKHRRGKPLVHALANARPSFGNWKRVGLSKRSRFRRGQANANQTILDARLPRNRVCARTIHPLGIMP